MPSNRDGALLPFLLVDIYSIQKGPVMRTTEEVTAARHSYSKTVPSAARWWVVSREG